MGNDLLDCGQAGHDRGGRLALHEKITDEMGNTVEMKILQVPLSEDKPHGYKYFLV